MHRPTIAVAGVRAALVAWTVSLMTVSTSASAQSAWKVEKNVEIVVPSAAGGGLDRSARALQRIWQESKTFPGTPTVVNKPGGSGTLGYTYLAQAPADGHHIMISSPTLLTNHIRGIGKHHHSDFTPLAQLSSEYLVLVVRADSPIKSAKEVIDRLRKDPGGLSVAVGSVLGGANHIGIGAVFKSAGVDIRKLRTVVFKSGTESVTALMGGHVDLSTGSPAQSLAQLEAGRIRVLAIASPQRLTGAFASTPTWKELGYNVEANTWRGLIAPKGLTPAQVAYWDATIAKVVATPEWKQEVERNHSESTHLNSVEARKFLDAEYRDLKAVLTEIGLAK
jgi:putative tricarboxylic transport membrane protein